MRSQAGFLVTSNPLCSCMYTFSMYPILFVIYIYIFVFVFVTLCLGGLICVVSAGIVRQGELYKTAQFLSR